ncbi:MAG TPA: helix-turn-helix domain-containing protein [Fibrobacteria bacterium]|nr:helix-turn-helix domain-containing protein [Fibrobacteria bacterium]HOX50195.1 helix-turn-helix domain-containing protein [Fibrobacteria bacterium]
MRIWLADYPGNSRMSVEGLRELFSFAGRAAVARFDLEVGPLDGSGREARFRFLAKDDPWVVVPPGADAALPLLVDGDLPSELRRHHGRGHRVAAVCAGNFALAAAGLLQGRAATTHWNLEESFRRMFPRERLSMERILLDHGDVVSAGGYTAFVDLGLFLVGRAAGRAVALQVARILQVDPSRENQLPWLGTRPLPVLPDPVLASVVRRIGADPGAPWDLAGLAKESGVGMRTLERRFRDALGTSPRRWIQERRLEKARELLEGGASLADACQASGWSDVPSFVRLFRERGGMTPARYREWARSS